MTIKFSIKNFFSIKFFSIKMNWFLKWISKFCFLQSTHKLVLQWYNRNVSFWDWRENAWEKKKRTTLNLGKQTGDSIRIKKHLSFAAIADVIVCSPDTISKEIRKHRYFKERTKTAGNYNRVNDCKYQDTCKKRNLCNKKKGYHCRIQCNKCMLKNPLI